MTRVPFIAHSELTNEIYIVSGRKKYRVTGQAIKAVNAIKALEQESCDDCVSRQAVLDLAKDLIVPLKDGATYKHRCIDPQCVRELPPVQPKSRWIPVSERLPEKGGDYLVTTEWKGSYSGDVYTETNMAVYREKEKEWDCAGIVAWMPLPEPYDPTN